MDFQNIIIYTDMDGTVLTDWDLGPVVPRRSLASIKRFMEKEGTFSIASGRQYLDILPYFPGLVPNAPLVQGNGTSLYDCIRQKVVYSLPLSWEYKEESIKMCLENPWIWPVAATVDTVMQIQMGDARDKISHSINGIPVSIEEYLQGEFSKIVYVVDDPAHIAKARALTDAFCTAPQMQQTMSSPIYLEPMDKLELYQKEISFFATSGDGERAKKACSDLKAFLKEAGADKEKHSAAILDVAEIIIGVYVDQNTKSIIETSTLNNPEVISEVIHLMQTAQRIDFYGVGPSNVVARDAYIKCMRLGIPSSAIEDPMSMRMNVRAYPKGALALLISYTGETDSIIEVAKELNAMRITSVSLTSFGENRLASLCTHNLYVQSSESWDRLGGMSSRISTLNLVDVLFTALMNTNYQKYVDIMNHTNIPNRESKG